MLVLGAAVASSPLQIFFISSILDPPPLPPSLPPSLLPSLPPRGPPGGNLLSSHFDRFARPPSHSHRAAVHRPSIAVGRDLFQIRQFKRGAIDPFPHETRPPSSSSPLLSIDSPLAVCCPSDGPPSLPPRSHDDTSLFFGAVAAIFYKLRT